jgi:hypothetical protein
MMKVERPSTSHGTDIQTSTSCDVMVPPSSECAFHESDIDEVTQGILSSD